MENDVAVTDLAFRPPSIGTPIVLGTPDNLYTQIHGARKEIQSIIKTKDVSYKPGTTAYSYAPIEDVINNIQDHLNNYDLVIMSKTEYSKEITGAVDFDGFMVAGTLRTEIIYTKTGEREASIMPLFVRIHTRGIDYNSKQEKITDNNLMQELSKAKTTARRTSIVDLLNLAIEDTDCNTKDAVITPVHNSYTKSAPALPEAKKTLFIEPPKSDTLLTAVDMVKLQDQIKNLWELKQEAAEEKDANLSQRITIAIKDGFKGLDDSKLDGMRKWLQKL